MGGATLYEDMQYEFKETRREKQERDDLAMETIRLFKKQKAEETHKEKQQRTIEDWLEFLKTSQEALETCEADIKDLGRWIPPVTSETLKDALDLVKTTIYHCGEMKDSGECLDLQSFCATMAEFERAFNEKKSCHRHTNEGSKEFQEVHVPRSTRLCNGCITG